ncbi:8824_t:CDS:10, partial [Paraglomus occultum]
MDPSTKLDIDDAYRKELEKCAMSIDLPGHGIITAFIDDNSRYDFTDCTQMTYTIAYTMELLANVKTPSFTITNNVSDRLTNNLSIVESLIINQQCVGKWIIDDAEAAELFMKTTRKSGMTDDELINEYCNVNTSRLNSLFMEPPLISRNHEAAGCYKYTISKLSEISRHYPIHNVDSLEFAKRELPSPPIEEACQLQPYITEYDAHDISSLLNGLEENGSIESIQDENLVVEQGIMEEILIPAKADKVHSQWPLGMKEIGSVVSKEMKTENTEALLEQLDQLVPEGKGSRSLLEWDNDWEGSISNEYQIASVFNEDGIYEELSGIDNAITCNYYLESPVLANNYPATNRHKGLGTIPDSMYQAIEAVASADKTSTFDLDSDLDGLDTDLTKVINRNMFADEWEKLIVEETADDFSKLKFKVPNLPNPKSVVTEQNKARASFPYIPNALVDLISSATFTQLSQPSWILNKTTSLELDLSWNPIKGATGPEILRIIDEVENIDHMDNMCIGCEYEELPTNELVPDENEAETMLLSEREEGSSKPRSKKHAGDAGVISDVTKTQVHENSEKDHETRGDGALVSSVESGADDTKLTRKTTPWTMELCDSPTQSVTTNQTDKSTIPPSAHGLSPNRISHIGKDANGDSCVDRQMAVLPLARGKRMISHIFFADNFSATKSINNFLLLRGKKKMEIIHGEEEEQSATVVPTIPVDHHQSLELLHELSVEQNNTLGIEYGGLMHLSISDIYPEPRSTLTYIISARLLQNRHMVATLRSDKCKIELIERDFEYLRPFLPDDELASTHVDADLIIDECTAITYHS